MSDAPPDLVVGDNPGERRYEARLGDQVVGYSEYELDSRAITFVHTEVDPAFEGRGFGSRLAGGVLDDARARGLRVRVRCPFILAWIRRHSEYRDLLKTGREPQTEPEP
jgi:hypothetical protein